MVRLTRPGRFVNTDYVLLEPGATIAHVRDMQELHLHLAAQTRQFVPRAFGEGDLSDNTKMISYRPYVRQPRRSGLSRFGVPFHDRVFANQGNSTRRKLDSTYGCRLI